MEHRPKLELKRGLTSDRPIRYPDVMFSRSHRQGSYYRSHT